MNTGTLVIGRHDLDRIVEIHGRDALMDLMIQRLHEAFISSGGVTPPRDGFERGDDRTGVLEWMPHREPGRGVTIKTVAYSPANPATFAMPTILGSVARFDDVTGSLLAIVDGVLLTAVRTGAASAVASRLLAHPASRVVGVIGAGAQAVTQAHALCRTFDVEQVLVYDIDPAHAASFVRRAAFLDVDVRAVELAELEAAADIVCTVTSVEVGAGPVLTGSSLRDHVHLNAVGADLPGKIELPLALLRRAFVCPDHPEQARREGECQKLRDDEIGPDLRTLCADPGLAASHRARPTVFDSTGFALEDHVAMDLIVDLAGRIGVGRYIALEHVPVDPLDPYSDGRPADIQPHRVPWPPSRPVPAGRHSSPGGC